MRFESTQNKQLKITKKVGSLLVIIIFVISGIFIIMPPHSKISTANEAPTTTERVDDVFRNGTCDNVEIIETCTGTELRLSYYEVCNWVNKTPVISPQARTSHAMASVPGTDKIVLYGGYTGWTRLGDTWVYDLSDNTWTKKSPKNNLGERDDTAMAPIFGTDKVLLFSGAGYGSNDTWIYDLSDDNWTNKTPMLSPSAREGHGMAAIHGTDKVLLFGGYAPERSDTWIYDYSDNTWTEKVYSTFPSSRGFCEMSTIYNTDKVLLFGGLNYPSSFLSDTWIFDLSEDKWTQKFPTNYPNGRCNHGQASIHGTDKVIVFGGYAFNDDTNIYDLSTDNWQLMSPTGKPTARFYQVMEAIQGTDKVMFFGGTVSGANNLAETWIYDLSDNTWLKMTISNFPRPRSLHAMATIDGTDMILLFGGYNGLLKDDTWVFKYYLPELEGTYVSQPHDTHANSSYNQLTWEADIPLNTSIKIQLRSGSNLTNLNTRSFVGFDGNTTTFYNTTTTDIWSGHDGDRYIQYKVYFNVMDFTQDTPSLREVTITYNCLPNVKIINPPDNAVITDNKPDFIWTFNDYDSAKQTAFQVLIDDDKAFTDVMFDSGEQNSNEENWEFPIGTGYSELPDGRWFWKLRARDEDGVWTEFNAPRRLTVDSKIPSSSPVIPDNNGFYYDLDSVVGVATDSEPSSGMKKVEITIKNLNSNEYWDGSSWVAFQIWLTTIGTFNWTYDSNQIQWSSGVQYSIQSRAIDNASNIEEPRDEIIFTIDTGSPVSSINEPQDDVWVNNLHIISGSSLDIGGSGLERVEICIKCINDNNKMDTINEENKYWDGDAWDTNECWLLAEDTIQWKYNFTRIPWNTCNNYLICSRAIDGIGNQEQPGLGVNFTYDDIAPEPITIKINNDDQYTRTTAVALSLNAEDFGSGISSMAFSVDGQVWSNWQPFNNTKSFYLSGGDGEKSIYFKVKDIAGNIAKTAYDSIILDSTPPEGSSININNNAKYTNSPAVKLNLYATDSGSGIGNMSLSSDGINWRDWTPYYEERIFSLTGGDGEKSIYFRVMDNAGKVIDPISSSIILDTSPPNSLSIQINNGELETNVTTVYLNLHAIDETSGVNQISLSNDGITWSAWEDYTELKYYTLLPGDGKKTVYFKVKDYAGNIAEPVSATIILNTTSGIQAEDQPQNDSSFSPDTRFFILLIIIIIFVLLIISMFIVLKRKDRDIQKLITSGSLTIKPTEMLPTKTTAEQLAEPEKPEELPRATAAIEPQAPIPAVPPVPALPPAKGEESTSKPEAATQVTTPQVATEPQPESPPTPSEQLKNA